MRRFLALRDHVRDLHVMLQEEVARRIASPPGSREYGILSVLYGLTSEVVLVAHFPAAVLRAAPEGQLGGAPGSDFSRRRGPTSSDLAAFETFLQKAFSRRRRTLENNLQDSYPNLKDYLRFLNFEGSRRAEALSVVELARLWAALTSGAHEERSSGPEARLRRTRQFVSSRSAAWASSA